MGVSERSKKRVREGAYATIRIVNERRSPAEYAPSFPVLFRREATGQTGLSLQEAPGVCRRIARLEPRPERLC
jgi:hypothetical protein